MKTESVGGVFFKCVSLYKPLDRFFLLPEVEGMALRRGGGCRGGKKKGVIAVAD